MKQTELAVFGGTPIRLTRWPKWPRATPATQRAILEVLHSGKWAISGWSEAPDTFERQASKCFAAYVDRRYCVACSSGSAALLIALQALGVGPGDEVILTGLTWVACPNAVLRLGARPILVDIEPNSLCASAATIEAAITDRTRVILMIHMYSSLCDPKAYADLSNRFDIPLIEDGSQAHGAVWNGRHIGSFGEISIFSTQQSKLLTSGEGGLCVTDDVVLYERMQQMRADGRRYRVDPFGQPPADNGVPSRSLACHGWSEIAPDGYELEAAGDVAGQNLCLTEFQAALLLEGLGRLDEENAHRLTCVDSLAACLEKVEGVELIVPPKDVNKPTYYRLAIQIDRSAFDGLSAHELVPALAAELNADLRRVDAPLNMHPLYSPTKTPFVAGNPELCRKLEPSQFELPIAEMAYAEIVTLPHQMLLSAPEDMQDVSKALDKVRRFASLLKARASELELHQEV